NQVSSQPMRNYLTPQPNSAIGRCWQFTGHTNVVRAIAWSSDGTTLASASKDGTLRLWDAVNGTALGLLGRFSAWNTCVAWHPTEPLIASGTSDKRILLWQLPARQVAMMLTGHMGRITALCWAADPAELLSASADKSIRRWNIKQGITIQQL